jgi:hypothetical protein
LAPSAVHTLPLWQRPFLAAPPLHTFGSQHKTRHKKSDLENSQRARPLCHPQLLRIEEELGDKAVYAGDNYHHIPIA